MKKENTKSYVVAVTVGVLLTVALAGIGIVAYQKKISKESSSNKPKPTGVLNSKDIYNRDINKAIPAVPPPPGYVDPKFGVPTVK